MRPTAADPRIAGLGALAQQLRALAQSLHAPQPSPRSAAVAKAAAVAPEARSERSKSPQPIGLEGLSLASPLTQGLPLCQDSFSQGASPITTPAPPPPPARDLTGAEYKHYLAAAEQASAVEDGVALIAVPCFGRDGRTTPLFRLLLSRLWFSEDQELTPRPATPLEGDATDGSADGVFVAPLQRRVYQYPLFGGGGGRGLDAVGELVSTLDSGRGVALSALPEYDARDSTQAVPFDPDFSRTRQHRAFKARNGSYDSMPLRVVYEPNHAGFEGSKAFPLEPGVLIAGRYRIVEVLGEATFCRAVRCDDLEQPLRPLGFDPLRTRHPSTEPEYVQVCLKVIANNKEFFDQTLDEIKILNLLSDEAAARFQAAQDIVQRSEAQQQELPPRGAVSPTLRGAEQEALLDAAWLTAEADTGADAFHVVSLLDCFYHLEHMFLVCEILSDNLYEFGRHCRKHEPQPYFTVPRTRRIARQVLEALAFVHSLGILHSDLKPENILFVSHRHCNVKVIDFGSSVFEHDRLSSYVQSRSYRAPEVVLGAPYDGRLDVWSVGCILVEQVTNQVLFHSNSVPEMLARIVATCGPIPAAMLHRSRHADTTVTRDGVIFAPCEQGDDVRHELFKHGEKPFAAVAAAVAFDEQQGRTFTSDGSHEENLFLFSPVVEPAGDGELPLGQTIPHDVWASAEQSLTDLARYLGRLGEICGPQRRLVALLTDAGVDVVAACDRLPALLDGMAEAADRSASFGEDPKAAAQRYLTENDGVLGPLLFLDFVQQCLTLDPQQRPTSEQLLDHPFVARCTVTAAGLVPWGEMPEENGCADADPYDPDACTPYDSPYDSADHSEQSDTPTGPTGPTGLRALPLDLSALRAPQAPPRNDFDDSDSA